MCVQEVQWKTEKRCDGRRLKKRRCRARRLNAARPRLQNGNCKLGSGVGQQGTDATAHSADSAAQGMVVGPGNETGETIELSAFNELAPQDVWLTVELHRGLVGLFGTLPLSASEV
jgi:hypothetical protein